MTRTMVDTPAGSMCVETGTGSFIKVEDEKGRNQQISIRADGLQHPIKGWLDKTNPDLVAALEKVRTEWAGRFAYRIDVVRGNGVAAEVPWADLQPIQKFRRLVAIRPELELAQLTPAAALASVGAPAGSAASQAPVGASRPPAPPDAPTPPSAVAAAHRPDAAADHAPRCVSCGESTAGRPVKRVPNGYVHTDTACLEAPFTDPAADPEGGDGKTVLEAGREATAQRAAHRSGGAATDEEAARIAAKADEVAAEAGLYRCPLCQVATNEPRETHEASTTHMGKARQAEHAAELEARRKAQIAQAAQVDDGAHPVKPPAVPLPQPRGPRVAEGRPWEKYNSDGSVNMGSYGMQANTACVNWAQRLVIERVRALAGETGAQAHIDPAQVRSLARTLLTASDRIQANTREDGHIDRMDNSHTRARSALAAALHVYPVPFGADDEVKGKWLDDVAAWAVMLINMAVELDR